MLKVHSQLHHIFEEIPEFANENYHQENHTDF